MADKITVKKVWKHSSCIKVSTFLFIHSIIHYVYSTGFDRLRMDSFNGTESSGSGAHASRRTRRKSVLNHLFPPQSIMVDYISEAGNSGLSVSLLNLL